MHRSLLLFLAVAFAPSVLAAQPHPTKEDFRSDFELAWREIAANYAYFDGKQIAWNDLPRLYAPDLARVATRQDFIALLEQVIDELYDPHAQLNVNGPHSWRLVPSGTDLWAEWRDGLALIIQVRAGSDAERAGIKAGDVVTAIDGRPIATAVDSRLGRTHPRSVPAARDWALRSVLAGRHDAARAIELRAGGQARSVLLPARDQYASRPPTPLDHSEMRPGVGYIRLDDSLGDGATIAAFDHALGRLRDTRALVLDLRNTASGGNSTVARAILGRFVSRETPYQKHALVAEERETGVRRSWLELVSPRGEFTYQKPVAVLVDHWTGSMGEGIAVGFDALERVTVVGTPMARLVGATEQIALPRTGIGMNLPTERLYHVNGTPREAYQPRVLVDVVQAAGGEDPFIAAALRVLEK